VGRVLFDICIDRYMVDATSFISTLCQPRLNSCSIRNMITFGSNQFVVKGLNNRLEPNVK